MFLNRSWVHCHTSKSKRREQPSTFFEVAEVFKNRGPHDVRLPGHRWLQPQEVQREDRPAQPEAGRGDPGLRAADDGPQRLKGKHSPVRCLLLMELINDLE